MRQFVTRLDMDEARISRLSNRHRECLRLIGELKGSKEIARELNITQNTVNSYVAEAVALLQARDRRDAARIFARLSPPQKVEGDSVRVETVLAPPADGRGDWAEHQTHVGGPTLPFRKEGSLRNELTSTQRLWWILAGGVLVALLLAATVNILDALVRVAKSATG